MSFTLKNTNYARTQMNLDKKALVKKIILDEFPNQPYQLIINGQPTLTSENNVFSLERSKSNMLNLFMKVYFSDNYLDLSKFNCIQVIGTKYPDNFFNSKKIVRYLDTDNQIITEWVKPNSQFSLLFNGIVPYIVIDSFDIGSIRRVSLKFKGDIIFEHDIDLKSDKLVLNLDFTDYCRKVRLEKGFSETN